MTVSPASPASDRARGSKNSERYYTTQLDTATHRDRIVHLWTSMWANAPEPAAGLEAKCDWFYNSNPAGSAICYELHDAEHDGAAAGMIVVAPRQFMFEGRPLIGGTSVDFVVSPSHRTYYPAVKLQHDSHAGSLARWDMMFGVPNERARRLCEKAKIGFHFRRPHFTAVLRTAPYLARIIPSFIARPVGALLDLALRAVDTVRLAISPRLKVEWLDEVDTRFDELWRRAPAQDRCIGVRDSAFLRWRFFRQPGRVHRILAVTSSDSSAKLIGYFVTEVDGKALAIRDVLIVGRPAEHVSAWLNLKRAARQLGMQTATCHLGADEMTLNGLRRSGFADRGQTIAIVLAGAALREHRAFSNGAFWYLTEADEDI